MKMEIHYRLLFGLVCILFLTNNIDNVDGAPVESEWERILTQPTYYHRIGDMKKKAVWSSIQNYVKLRMQPRRFSFGG